MPPILHSALHVQRKGLVETFVFYFSSPLSYQRFFRLRTYLGRTSHIIQSSIENNQFRHHKQSGRDPTSAASDVAICQFIKLLLLHINIMYLHYFKKNDNRVKMSNVKTQLERIFTDLNERIDAINQERRKEGGLHISKERIEKNGGNLEFFAED